MSPRQYQPSPEERDEKVNTELEADQLIREILRAGPHPPEDDKRRFPRKAKDKPKDS